MNTYHMQAQLARCAVQKDSNLALTGVLCSCYVRCIQDFPDILLSTEGSCTKHSDEAGPVLVQTSIRPEQYAEVPTGHKLQETSFDTGSECETLSYMWNLLNIMLVGIAASEMDIGPIATSQGPH